MERSDKRARSIWMLGFAVVFLVAAGCGGGGGGGGDGGGGGGGGETPAAPIDLKLSASGNFNEVTLTWTPPAGDVDSYQLEDRVDDSPYEKFPELIPGNVVGLVAEIDPATPELVELWVRMRSLRNGVFSPYSAEASMVRGLRPPEGASTRIIDEEQVQLTWTQRSLKSDALRIERAVYDDVSYTYSDYVPVVDLPLAATDYVDSDLLAGKLYRYRLRNLGTYEGQQIESSFVDAAVDGRIGVLPPADIAVSVVGNRPVLTWVNRSTNATELVVLRGDGFGVTDPYGLSRVAQLEPDATVYVDTSAGPGVYTYAVVAASLGYGFPSERVSALVQPTSSEISLAATLVHLPAWTGIVPDAGGRWHIAYDPRVYASGVGGPSLSLPAGNSWATHAMPKGSLLFAEPSVLLDAQNRPHTVYLKRAGTGTTLPEETDVIHEWYDGAVWQRETVARRTINASTSSPGIWFDLTSDGATHILWELFSWGRFPEYATNAGGSWSVSSLTSALYDPSKPFSSRLVTFSDGTVVAAFATASGTVVLEKAPSQDWVGEVAPSGPTFFDSWRLAAGGGTLGLFYTKSSIGRYGTYYRARSSGGWGPEEVIVESDEYTYPGMPAAVSGDGNRAALLSPNASGLWLHVRSPDGTWRSELLRQRTDFEKLWVDFDSDGMAEVLAPAGPLADGFRDCVLYEETP